MFNQNQLLKTATQRFTAAGAAFGFLFPIGATALSLLVNHLPLGLASVLQVQRTQPLLWIIDSAPFFLGLFASFGGRREDALRQANKRLRELSEKLEQRVAERTRELERRTAQMPAIIEIGHAASQVHDPDDLLRRAVELIRASFDLYYVAVFLVDEAGQNAVLRAGTGEPGRIMLAGGHKLAVGGNSMVGWACAHQQARIALDVGQEAVRFANPMLPETHSEMALPIRVGERVFGALDIQSAQARAFDDNDITVLQGMADQIAVAMENAWLFQQAQASLKEVERINQLLTQQEWEAILSSRTTDFAEFHQPGVASFTPEEIEGLALSESQGSKSGIVCVPLTVRDQVIGTLIVEQSADQPDGSKATDTRQQAAGFDLLEPMAAQVAQAMESARLFEDTQRRAARERLTAQVTARMRQTLDLDAVLQTAVREISAALGLVALDVHLGTEAETIQDSVPSLSEQ
jgi:GAF domain-containing protein